MNKNHAKRQRDIKTKLMAAICMLLVSSIMMVSTTYAWFTLSTAPEVTGITTAVGANGNLEMALLPTSGDLNSITTSANDSTKADNLRNITWGNLVDLSDSTYYGLDEITLYPSALNTSDKDAAGNPLSLASGSILSTPAYGADGRISNLLANTSTGIYDSQKTAFYPDASGVATYGVRAVGTASGMTERQLSYRNARGNASDAQEKAATLASQSLFNNGNALASIAVKKAADANATYSADDLASMGAIIEDLTTSGGILDQIETAYIQYLLAFAASQQTGEEDIGWSTVKAAVEASDATLDSVLQSIQGILPDSVTLPDVITTGIAAYNTSVQSVKEAKQAYEDLNNTGEPYTWTQISPILQKLADPDKMLVNDIPAADVMERKQEIIDDVVAAKGITVTVTTGGGVYADIADQCGDYTAQVRIENVEFSGMTLNTDATMNTKSNLAPNYYLTLLGASVLQAGAPASGATGETPMTDMYGYIIDLAFRTNASNSNLLLQIDAADRIYDGNDTGVQLEGSDESTMGHGSSMTFAATTATFSNDQVKGLMEAIRIIFFDTDRKVLATAKLDVANATVGTDGITAKMYVYELTAGGEVSYNPVDYAEGSGKTYYTKTEAVYEEANPAADGDITYYVKNAQNGYDVATDTTNTETTYYKLVTAESWSEIADTDAETANVQLYEKVVSEAGETKLTDNVITALTQNTATAISVLVYLDGDYVENGDVAATAATSMTGKMNLQFASSANLVPMEYTPLMEQGGTSSDASTEATTESTGE